jgi:hypothetical protein
MSMTSGRIKMGLMVWIKACLSKIIHATLGALEHYNMGAIFI